MGETVTPCGLSWEGRALPPPLAPSRAQAFSPWNGGGAPRLPSMATASHSITGCPFHLAVSKIFLIPSQAVFVKGCVMCIQWVRHDR